MKKKKYILIILLLILFIASLSVIVKRHSTKNNVVEPSKDIPLSEDIEECNITRELIIGIWAMVGEEGDIPSIKFLDNNQFILNQWGGDGVTEIGTWELIKNETAQIRIQFFQLPVYWESAVEEIQLGYYENVEIDNISNSILFKIGYLERKEDFNNTCKTEHYYINMFNNLVYRNE